MKCLLIAQSNYFIEENMPERKIQKIPYAKFIQQGFENEHLQIKLLDIANHYEIEQEMIAAQGIFLLSSEEQEIKKIIGFCREIDTYIPIFYLTINPKTTAHFKKNFPEIEMCFERPLNFRRIVLEMKFCAWYAKHKQQKQHYVLRDLELNLNKHEVLLKKKPIKLRNKEFSLLHFLMEHPEQVLSRSTILEHVWDRNADLNTNTVDVHMSQLRKKINQDKKDSYIQTIPCSGYMIS